MIFVSGETEAPPLPKFMQTLNDPMYRELEKVAQKKGITVQELIRAVIVPDWVEQNEVKRKKSSD